eukprot:jgi/Botrbrau1/8879/Bobra.50_2s0034.1
MGRLTATVITAHILILQSAIPSTFASRHHNPGSWGTVESGSDVDLQTTAQAQQNVTCPPPGFQSLEPFSLRDYAGTWYVQAQMPVLYLQPASAYCVRARYTPVNPSNITEGVIVDNFARVGGVNGMPQNPAGYLGFLQNITNNIFQLRARVVNASRESELSVGPAFPGPIAQFIFRLFGRMDVPNWLQGAYWVVAAGPGKSTDPNFKGYEWAIITGGPPRTPSNGACRTGSVLPPTTQVNDVGYWIFTRQQTPPQSLVDKVKSVGASLGLDNSVLLTVAQEGCVYPS